MPIRTLWAALIALFLMLSALPASAQTETPPVEEPTEQATESPTEVTTEPAIETPVEQETRTPVDAQTPPPTEESTLTPTAEPGQQALEFDTTAAVVVQYRVCPPGTDVPASNPATLATICTDGQDGIAFDLRSPDVHLGAQYTGDGGPSRVAFSDVLVGPVRLTRVAPTTHRMAVYCQGDTPTGTSKTYAPMVIVGDNQAQVIQVNLVTDETVTCDWFVADAAPVASTLIIRTAACPPGTDYIALTIQGARATCVHPTGLVNFSVAQVGGGYDGGTKAAGITLPWSTQFNNVPNVPLRISEGLPTGFGEPAAFCGVDDRNGSEIAPVSRYQTSGGAFDLAAPGENVVIECDIFNQLPPTGSVVNILFDCPVGFDVTHDLHQLSASCHDNPGIVDYTVEAGAHVETKPTDGLNPGIVDFTGVPAGPVTITETLPAGYGAPVVFCSVEWERDGTDVSTSLDEVPVQNGNQIERSLLGGQLTYCSWFNFPPESSSVTVYKWDCPAGTEYGEDQGYYQAECATVHLNIPITLRDANGEHPTTTQANGTEWDGVVLDAGGFQVTVDEPDGYGDPMVFCGTLDAAAQTKMMATGGAITVTPATEPFAYQCNWYDIPYRDGMITIHKWTCPAGNDPEAWNADPAGDCAAPTDGVSFVLDGPGGADQQGTTDSSGTVDFDGLEPGSYTVSETVPDGVGQVFVLDCIGLNTGSVHPVPLSVGPDLQVDVASGDEIACDWYNVPGHDPETGWVTVSKQICWTPEYVSEVDCEVFEGGQSFDLERWNGSDWTGAGSGTTDGAGKLVLAGLEPGAYRIVEQGDAPCRIDASSGGNDGHLDVQASTETAVKVYNCSSTPPPVGGMMPTKFPNTGAGSWTEDRELPASSILGLAGIATAATMTRRQLLRRSMATALAGTAGSFGPGSSMARHRAEPIGTPEQGCLYPATPIVAVPGTPVACPRGEVPAHIAIASIDVDAAIEILETVGGEMQAPSGPEDVAWYKESARLGEQGNILMAGHLNYWGVPEGVFFGLASLRAGDVIEIEGESGAIFRYLVQWREEFPAEEEPPEEVLGYTGNQSLTLITCGGEWDVAAAEYDHRSVVRAEREVSA